MGRTKRWVGQIAFFVVSGAAVYAAFYFTFKSKPKTQDHGETAQEEVSHADSHEEASESKHASKEAEGHGEKASALEHSGHQDGHKEKLSAHTPTHGESLHAEDHASSGHEKSNRQVAQSGPMPSAHLKKFSWGWAFGTPYSKESGINVCQPFEYLAGGPATVAAMDKKWPALKKQFHKAKADLQSFIATQSGKLKTEEINAFKEKVAELRILRPVTTEEFDLLYRGIGTWVRDQAGRELLRVSPGLIKMVELNPARSQFEITRLVAQALSPCALEKIGATQAWSEFLSCMDLKDISADCKEGGYSEAGWAVSSALAQATTDPQCTVPAFKTDSGAKCFAQFMGDFKTDRKVAEEKTSVKTAKSESKKEVKKSNHGEAHHE